MSEIYGDPANPYLELSPLEYILDYHKKGIQLSNIPGSGEFFFSSFIPVSSGLWYVGRVYAADDFSEPYRTIVAGGTGFSIAITGRPVGFYDPAINNVMFDDAGIAYGGLRIIKPGPPLLINWTAEVSISGGGLGATAVLIDGLTGAVIGGRSASGQGIIYYDTAIPGVHFPTGIDVAVQIEGTNLSVEGTLTASWTPSY